METALKLSSNNLLASKTSHPVNTKTTAAVRKQRVKDEVETLSLMSAKSGSLNMLNGGTKSGSINMLNKVRASNSMLNDNESVYSFATGTTGRHRIKINEKDPIFTGLVKPRFVKREESEIFALKFSPENEHLIAACGNGNILVYSMKTNQLSCTLPASRVTGQDIDLPATCIAFRPIRPEFKNAQVMVVGYANGKLIHWHYPTGQKLASIQMDGDNQVNTVDYSINGKQFAAAGTHPHIKIYDSKTQLVISVLDTGKFDVTAAHSNRIFSVKYHPKDPNVLISGGWDNTIQIWDLKSATSTKSIFNTYICGDSIDFNESGDKILTGSYRKQDAIQIWNYATTKLETTVPWTIIENQTERNCMIYTAKFSHTVDAKGNSSNAYIIAGGSNPVSNEVRIFLTQTKRCVGMIHNIPHSIFTSDMSKNERMFACAGNGKTIFCCDVDPNLYNDFAY